MTVAGDPARPSRERVGQARGSRAGQDPSGRPGRRVRPSLGALVLLLALAGCAGGPKGLSSAAEGRIAGRAIVTAEGDPAEARRAAAQFGNPTPWTAPIFGAAVSVLGDFSESSRTRVGAVPIPERDPTRTARGAIVDYLVTEFHGVRGGRPFDAAGIAATNPAARARALFERAQAQGFPGVIVDLQPRSFRVRSAGVWTGLRVERFYLDYDADLLVVDAADGAVLAQGSCAAKSRAAPFTLAELEARGMALLDAAADLVARQCAAQLIQSRLLPKAGPA